MGLTFEWDPNKAASNLRKHDVTFEEAATVFEDWLSITVLDPDHSETEERHITVGMSKRGRLLLVAHTERQTRIRIISARQLTSREKRVYERGNYRER
ncbi:MAG: BrnT family toxin [Chloroflexi bacterium]|nr:BrnT family toxin [Chloroflexota bacterium]